MYSWISIATEWRKINPEQIVEIKIFKNHSQEDSTKFSKDKIVIINEPSKIVEGFQLLTRSKAFTTRHNYFHDGYVIQLKLKDQVLFSDYYLYVFKKGDWDSSVDIVMPHIGTSPGSDAGEYSCPEFHVWVKNNIDPLFGVESEKEE
jgi:hypothetical protein